MGDKHIGVAHQVTLPLLVFIRVVPSRHRFRATGVWIQAIAHPHSFFSEVADQTNNAEDRTHTSEGYLNRIHRRVSHSIAGHCYCSGFSGRSEPVNRQRVSNCAYLTGSAVTNAGGLGVIGGLGYTPKFLKEQIQVLKDEQR